MSTTVPFGSGNLYGGYTLTDKGWDTRVAGQVSLITSMSVDLFVAMELHEENGMNTYFLSQFPSGWSMAAGQGGNHLLYKTAAIDVLATSNVMMPGDRYMSRWQVRDKATQLVYWVAGAHFRANDDDGTNRAKERADEAAFLAKEVKKGGNDPTIIAGDFNSQTAASGYPRSILKQAGWSGLKARGAVTNGDYDTHGTGRSGKWIDDIMTKPATTVGSSALVQTSGLSDHNWLKTTIDFHDVVPAPTVEVPDPPPVVPPPPPPWDAPVSEPALVWSDLPPGDHAPLTIEVWDKDYVRRGIVTRPTSVTGSIMHNSPGTFSFQVDADHPRIDDLVASGSRAVIIYRYSPTSSPITIYSGPIRERDGSGPAVSSVRTFTVADDWAEVFNGILGWPNPTGTITQQGDDTAYYTRTGDAETVLKDITAVNATRQAVTLSVPSPTGMGAQVTVSVRMHPLADRLFPAVGDAGLAVRVLQQDSVRRLLAKTPSIFDRVLTEESGAVVDGSFALTAPTVTRVVVGAGGEGTARIFREYIDDDLEADFGFSACVFVDARDIDPAATDLEAQMQGRAADTFASGDIKTSLRVVLAETPQFRFGRTFNLSDQVSVQLSGGPVFTDIVREVQFSYTSDAGLVITPLVGNWTDSPSEALYAAVSTLARSVRDSARR